MRPADVNRLAGLCGLGAFVFLVVWGLDDIREGFAFLTGPTVQTSRQPTGQCILPTEHEQLVIVFAWRDGKLRHRCMFTGPRGTYRPAPKAGP